MTLRRTQFDCERPQLVDQVLNDGRGRLNPDGSIQKLLLESELHDNLNKMSITANEIFGSLRPIVASFRVFAEKWPATHRRWLAEPCNASDRPGQRSRSDDGIRMNRGKPRRRLGACTTFLVSTGRTVFGVDLAADGPGGSSGNGSSDMSLESSGGMGEASTGERGNDSTGESGGRVRGA